MDKIKRFLAVVMLSSCIGSFCFPAVAATIHVDLFATITADPDSISGPSNAFDPGTSLSISFDIDGTDLDNDPTRFVSMANGTNHITLNDVEYEGSGFNLLLIDYLYNADPDDDSLLRLNLTHPYVLTDGFFMDTIRFTNQKDVDFSGLELDNIQFEEDYAYLMNELCKAILNDENHIAITLSGLADGDSHFLYATADSLEYKIIDAKTKPVPIPSSLLLFGCGFIGLTGFRRFLK
jgi:hypothetical protein